MNIRGIKRYDVLVIRSPRTAVTFVQNWLTNQEFAVTVFQGGSMHGVGEAPIVFCKVLSVNKMTAGDIL